LWVGIDKQNEIKLPLLEKKGLWAFVVFEISAFIRMVKKADADV